MIGPLAAALLLAVASAAADGAPPDPDVAGLSAEERRAALVARSAFEHARLETLEAAFVQRQESDLLLEPETSEGTFCYRAPDAMRWDYASPSPRTVIVRDQSMITWHHDRDEVERVELGRRFDKLMRLLGPGSSLAELEAYFSLAVTFPETDAEPYRVRLEPKSRRFARRLAGLDMEIDRRLFLPVLLRIEDAGGGVTELRFEEIEINRPLPADRFEVSSQDSDDVTVDG